MINFININYSYKLFNKKIMNKSLISSKSSNSKPKRGLSLSLQKRKSYKKNQNDQNNNANIKGYDYMQKACDNLVDCKRNKIKFVQSYKYNDTKSKFEKLSIFKNINQDLKLGGNKRSQKRNVQIPINNQYANIQRSVDINQFTIASQRKTLRQSKVINLTSNIKYFQSINIPEQNILSTDYLYSHIPQTFQVSKKTQQLNNFHLQTKSIQKPFRIVQQQFQFHKQQQLQSHKQQKLSSNYNTVKKLQMVQAQIDNLLAKTQQTRAIFQKSSTIVTK